MTTIKIFKFWVVIRFTDKHIKKGMNLRNRSQIAKVLKE